jgi:asparagine synthetase A
MSKIQIIAKKIGEDFIVKLVDDVPMSIAHAYASPNVDDWSESTDNEMDSIIVHGSY